MNGRAAYVVSWCVCFVFVVSGVTFAVCCLRISVCYGIFFLLPCAQLKIDYCHLRWRFFLVYTVCLFAVMIMTVLWNSGGWGDQEQLNKYVL